MQIATSNPVTKNVIIHGIKNKYPTNPDIKNNLKENVIKICCKICPDKIFANNRIVKLKILAIYDTVSKKIINQLNVNVNPFGINKLKKFHL